MKNRLMLLALAAICYGNMQAEGWFANQWNRLRNYTPYRYGSSVYQSGDAAARTVASAGRLYEDPKLVSDLENDYYNSEDSQLNRQQRILHYLRYEHLPKAQENLFNASQGLQPYYQPHASSRRPFEDIHQQAVQRMHNLYNERNAAEKEWDSLNANRNSFMRQIRQEKNQQRPSYELFQHPSRNILGEY